jgi:rod shape-determining protein MreC
MQHELRLIHQMAQDNPELEQTISSLKKRHQLELQRLLHLQLQAVPAKVIFRSPTSWNSSLWINLGETTNEELGKIAIAKNSPVLVGTSVVGVVDYIGKSQSRVRLITDMGLTPSVRAEREITQQPLLNEKIHAVIQLLKKTKGALTTVQEQDDLIEQLEKATQHFAQSEHSWFLAKGELNGFSKPLWRSQRHLLKGTGFNYDYADGEGPARDLRTGNPIDNSSKEAAIPLIKSGDILITTGMDGVFPPDLLVAQVQNVHMLKEGDYYYELDALPTAGNFDDLSLVFVLPPVGYDPEDKPQHVGWQ